MCMAGRRRFKRYPGCLAAAVLCSVIIPGCSYAQTAEADRLKSEVKNVSPADPNADPTEDAPGGKRIFGIIPNFRSSPSLKNYKPLTARQKFNIASLDSFDRGTIALAAAFAGEGQLTNADKTFSQGVKGYAHYFVTSYADFVIGDYMTEAIFPTILHQDPRYFRRGKGSGVGRLGYAVAQIFWTHNDSGTTSFNYSEVLGNSAAVAISQTYYPENRSVSNGISKLGTQLAVDMASNVLKEFWPDIERSFKGRKHHDDSH